MAGAVTAFVGVHACVSAGSDWKLISFARQRDHADPRPALSLQKHRHRERFVKHGRSTASIKTRIFSSQIKF